MASTTNEEKLNIINEEIATVHSIHTVLQDSMMYREFATNKNVIGDYIVVMEIIEKHLRNIMRLF